MKSLNRLHWWIVLALLLLGLPASAQGLLDNAAVTRDGVAGALHEGQNETAYIGARIKTRNVQTPQAVKVAESLRNLNSMRGQATTSSGTWRLYPLYGGEMTSIAMNPVDAQTVYVGTRDAGVFKTANGGQSWQPARQGLTFLPIGDLLIDPQNPNVLYAGTEFHGVWKTTDGGNSWFPSSNGLEEDMVVVDMAIDPQNASTLYAGLAGGYGLYTGHIYKSEDGGATWITKEVGIPRNQPYPEHISGLRALAVDPTNPSQVYAGTFTDGAYASANGAGTWSAINQGRPDNIVKALAIDPHHGNRLSALMCGGSGDQGYYIFESANWQRVSQDSSCPNNGLWSDLYFHPTNSSVIYSAGDRFVKSADGGSVWSGYNPDYNPPGGAAEMAFHPSAPDAIYAASSHSSEQSGGVYTTTDQGLNWFQSVQGITAVPISMVAIDPQSSSAIYAADNEGHLLRTLDGGATWEMKTVTSFSGDCWGIAVDPLNSQHIYVAEDMDVYESFDQGESFGPVAEVESDPNCIALAPGASLSVYVGTATAGIYKSPDGGVTWSQINQGVPLCYQGSLTCSIESIAVDPNNASTVWAGTQRDPSYAGGILKSTDGGEHWELKGLSEDFIEAIAVQPGDGNTILVGARFSDGRIFKSTDGGESWQVKLDRIARVKRIVYDPRDSSLVYAATEGYGVLRSFDAGETWYDYNAGIFYPVLYSLEITADDPPLLVAGSYGSGLYWVHPALNEPPNVPSDPVPADGANGVPTAQALSWSGGDINGDLVTYTLALGASDPPPIFATDVTTTHYAPSALITSTTYYWIITATDGLSTSVGATWSFTTSDVIAPPAVPVLLFPPDGAVTATQAITFAWQAGVGGSVDGYNLRLEGGDGYIAILTTTETSSFAVLSTGVHTWTVRAYNAAGYSGWATDWTVRVGAVQHRIYLPVVVREN